MSYLENKVVFITGASSGIGRATAKLLLESGAKVFDFSLKKLLSEQMTHENLYSFQGDVSNEANVIAGFETCMAKFGTVDALLNNAGLGLISPDLATTDLATFDIMMNVGMLGRFRMFHYQKPVLMGEVIVNPGDWVFGDIDGVISIPQNIAYEVLLAAEKLLFKEEEIREMVESGMKPTEVVKNGGYF